MAIDIKKARQMQESINKKSGNGDDDLFLYSNKLTEEDNIRLMPSPPVMNGMYFIEQEVWWIAGKMYMSNSTFGGVDVINEEIEAAKASKQADLAALLSAKKNDILVVKKETRYLLPILHLECKYDADDVLESCKVIDDKVKVLVAKPSLMREINGMVTARPYQNKTEDGIADRVKGFNMILSKTGKGLSTEYSAMGWVEPMEMDAKYYGEKVVPNVQELTEKMKKTDVHLRSVIRNYLYGEEIVLDANTSAPATQEQPSAPQSEEAKPTVAAIATQPEAAKTKTLPTPPASTNVGKITRPTLGKAKTRSLADDLTATADLDNLD